MRNVGAVDIGGTKIAVGVVDDSGRVLARAEAPSHAAEPYPDGMRRITSMLHKAIEAAGVPIAGIGIGATGPVHPFTGRFGDVDFLPLWSGESLVDDLAQEFRLPVALENDADAAALAEAEWGVGKSKPRLIYVTVGTGIGGGIVLNGQLYRGVDATHPEIGHQIIDPAGPACSCGFSGCWESLAAGPAIAAWFASQSGSGGGVPVTAKQICDLARTGDALALRSVAREALYLGIGLANLVNLFAPDAIILSGSVMKSSDLFLDGIRETMRRGCRFVPLDKVEITLASLGEDANLIGAAHAWHYRCSQNKERCM
jgi:glucokinase